MPLLDNEHMKVGKSIQHPIYTSISPSARLSNAAKQSQHLVIAKSAIMGLASAPQPNDVNDQIHTVGTKDNEVSSTRTSANNLPLPSNKTIHNLEHGAALTDTPSSTAPNSPRM